MRLLPPLLRNPEYHFLSGKAGFFLFLVLWMFASGCATLTAPFAASVSSKMADQLSKAFLNYDDLATVETALPAYLLMIESFIRQDPENESLLLTASKLYSGYVGAFVKDPERAARLSHKGIEYSLRVIGNRYSDARNLINLPFDRFQVIISQTTKDDLPALYALGSAWATEIQARQTDWNAVAQLPRIEAIMNRVLTLDEIFDAGGAHLYLGVFSTLLPPALGGRPEEGREHFERALAISGKKNLMALVLYARHYAKATFDRELHDRLLNEVLTSDPRVDGYVLANMAAQAEARTLMAAAAAYF